MKLEIGMYVRFKDKRGNEYIRKVIAGYKKGWYGCKVDIEANNVPYVSLKNVIKASYNIIDLIEVGDYVNGFRVENIYNPTGNEVFWIKLSCNPIDNYKNEDIKSIVTKEQFEQMSYKVGD